MSVVASRVEISSRKKYGCARARIVETLFCRNVEYVGRYVFEFSTGNVDQCVVHVLHIVKQLTPVGVFHVCRDVGS